MTRLALTNAHLIDPATDFDAHGGVLIQNCMIGEQLEMGVAVRMAVLEMLARNVTNEIAGAA